MYLLSLLLVTVSLTPARLLQQTPAAVLGNVGGVRIEARLDRLADAETSIPFCTLRFRAIRSGEPDSLFTVDLSDMPDCKPKMQVGDFLGLGRKQVFVVDSDSGYLFDCDGRQVRTLYQTDPYEDHRDEVILLPSRKGRLTIRESWWKRTLDPKTDKYVTHTGIPERVRLLTWNGRSFVAQDGTPPLRKSIVATYTLQRTRDSSLTAWVEALAMPGGSKNLRIYSVVFRVKRAGQPACLFRYSAGVGFATDTRGQAVDFLGVGRKWCIR